MLDAVLLVDQKIDAIGMMPRQVLTGTGAILIVSCFGGLLLMFISSSFAISQLMLAEAKSSNLIEEMKKSRAIEHRQRLWNRVIQYEQIRFTLRRPPERLRQHSNSVGVWQCDWYRTSYSRRFPIES